MPFHGRGNALITLPELPRTSRSLTDIAFAPYRLNVTRENIVIAKIITDADIWLTSEIAIAGSPDDFHDNDLSQPLQQSASARNGEPPLPQ